MITDLSQTTVIINDYDRLIMLIMRGVTGEVGFFPTNSLPFFSNIFYVPHVGVISVRLKSQCTLGRTALVAFSTGHFSGVVLPLRFFVNCVAADYFY